MTDHPTVAIAMDVDGVISPVHGPTTFGDDQLAGHAFGPVHVSPTLTRRLDALADRPDVTAVWLTTWPASTRLTMTGFPGRDWPDLKPPQPPAAPLDPNDWWKPAVLQRWLRARPHIQRLIWCDDHILPPLELLEPLTDAEFQISSASATPSPASPVLELVLGDLPASLIVPSTNRGLTAADIDRIEHLTRA